MTEPTPREPWPEPSDFPTEDEWLDLPCPPVSEDFCGRVLDRLRQDGADREGFDTDDDLAPVLRAFEAPEPSADFVERTLARMRREDSPDWQRLVQFHGVPEPTADFVDRVLAALRRQEPGPRPHRRARGEEHGAEPGTATWRRPVLAAAAAAAVVAAAYLVGLFDVPRVTHPDHDRVFAVAAARSFSPDRFGTALARVGARDLPVQADDPLLTLADVARRRVARTSGARRNGR